MVKIPELGYCFMPNNLLNLTYHDLTALNTLATE